ncbi:hypothetical protein ACSSS7_006063 [Eimeria intestinalis]
MLGSTWWATAAAAAAAGLAAAALVALVSCCTPVACCPAALELRGPPSLACFIKPHDFQVWDRDPTPANHSSVRFLSGRDTVDGEAWRPTRGKKRAPRSSKQGAPLPDEEEGGARSLKDLGTNKWLAQKLHEYVQAKEAEKRRVVSLLPFGCRVDVGCMDTLGLLHVRDMHFLPRALKAGAEYLRRAVALEVEPAGGDCLLQEDSSSDATMSGWIAHAGDVLKVGDPLCLKIKSIDRENRRMRLTTACRIGAFEGDTPRKAIGTFWAGQEVEGTVLRATSFGLFVDIGAVEDAFLHANELWRGDDKENVPQLYDKFCSSGRRRQRAAASSQVSPHVPSKGSSRVDDPHDPTQFSSGDKVTGLRVLDVDASRNRYRGARLCFQDLHELNTFSFHEGLHMHACMHVEVSLPALQHRAEEGPSSKAAELSVFSVLSKCLRIQLTTRSEAEVQRLLRWRRMALGLQRDAQQQGEESEEEKVAKLRAALKLLERHRKKHQLLGSGAQPSTTQKQQQQQQQEDIEGSKYARLFPGYSQADFDEALSLLEAEKRRKELLFLQAVERKARRRHPRFNRQSADDLSVQEAWQLLREEEPGVVTPEMLREDARRHAISARLTTAELPVFGPDGLPKMQQVPLKDLMSEARGGQQPAAAAGEKQQPAAAKGHMQAVSPAEARHQSRAAGDCEEETASVAASHSADVDLNEGDDPPEDLNVSPETIQRELAAYDEEGDQFQGAADAEVSSHASEETEGRYRLQHSSRTETPPRLGEAETPEASPSAQEIEAFFAKSQKALLASLRKGRTRRDRAILAAEEQEIQDLIQQDRERALEALAREARGSPAETRGEETAQTETEGRLREEGRRLEDIGDEEETEETLGDVSHAEVLKTIRDRLRVDPGLASTVRRQGASPEALATRVQSLLQQVTMPSVTSSVRGLQDAKSDAFVSFQHWLAAAFLCAAELAALLAADAKGDPLLQGKTSGRRRHPRRGSLHEAGPLEETGDEAEEGYVSPFFQLSDDADKGGLGLNDPPSTQGIDLGSAAESETAEQDETDDEDFTSYLQSTPTRPRRQVQITRTRAGSASRRSRAAAAAAAAPGAATSSSKSSSTSSNLRPQTAGLAEDAAADEAALVSGSSTPESPPMNTASARLHAAREGDASMRPIGLDSIKAAVLRARRGAAAAAAAGVSRVAQRQQIRGHQAAVVSSSGEREAESPLLASGLTSQVSPGTQLSAAHSEETETRRKAAAKEKPPSRSKPAIVLLPEQLVSTQGLTPATRPVRSLAEFRELQRQQPLLKQQQQQLPTSKGTARASSRGRPPPSQHRQLQQAVRRLHEQHERDT